MTVRAGREFLAIPGPTTMPDEVLQAALKVQPWFAPTVDGYVLRGHDMAFRPATEQPIGEVRGELFIAGRSKDLLLLRGRNHAPEEVERAAEAAARGCTSARCCGERPRRWWPT